MQTITKVGQQSKLLILKSSVFSVLTLKPNSGISTSVAVEQLH